MATNIASIDPSITKISKNPRMFGDTYINVVITNFTWTIHNFSASDLKSSAFLTSPVIMGGPYDAETLEWKIHLYPQDHSYLTPKHVLISLNLNHPMKTVVRAKAVFSIVNSLGINQKSIEDSDYTTWNVGCSSSCQPSNLISRSDLMNPSLNLLPNDTLTIDVEISLVVNTVSIVSKKRKHTQDVPKCRIIEDLSALYKSKKGCDVTFVAGNKKFPAHKAILMARSPVFSAMFNSKMAETQLNIIKITDMDGATIEAMLRFIYSGETTNLDKMAKKLLVAADKYDLERLKSLCEENLCNGLTIENVADQLILGDTHSAHRSKARAIDFIVAHMKDVIATAGYKSMHITHPNLMDEVVLAFAMRNSTKTAATSGAAT